MWLKVQRSWMYLQPIFDSEDIMKQLPAEGKRFKQVDSQWRRAMHAAHLNPKVIEICADENLRDTWMSANTMLDLVQKGLEDYLEMKRSLFARFYFLSNDELLEILSQTKDPTRVQPYLCKVFEAIGTVNFDEDLKITAMKSTDGEQIDFVEQMATKEKNVEQWMTEVEHNMKEAVRNAMEICVSEYPGGFVFSSAVFFSFTSSSVHEFVFHILYTPRAAIASTTAPGGHHLRAIEEPTVVLTSVIIYQLPLFREVIEPTTVLLEDHLSS